MNTRADEFILHSPLGPMSATLRAGRVMALAFDDPIVAVQRLSPAPFQPSADPDNRKAFEGLCAWMVDYFKPSSAVPADLRLPLPACDLSAHTPFRQHVWQTLLTVAPGETLTYAQLASRCGNPAAARAIASACAANPIALLIPCHRIVGAAGDLRGYRWGLERKRALLRFESEHGLT